MKLLLNIFAIVAFAGYAVAETATPSTLSQARKLLISAGAQLDEQAIALTDNAITIAQQKTDLSVAQTATVKAQAETAAVQKKADENQNILTKTIAELNALKDSYYELDKKYSNLSAKVHYVAAAVGVIFALLVGLAMAKFLGKEAILAGPYAAYVYGAASLAAFGFGFGLVEAYFRWNH